MSESFYYVKTLEVENRKAEYFEVSQGNKTILIYPRKSEKTLFDKASVVVYTDLVVINFELENSDGEKIEKKIEVTAPFIVSYRWRWKR